MPNFKSFLVTETEGKHAGDARHFNSIVARAVIKFFFLHDKAQKEMHSILRETLGEHAPSYVTVKNWVAQFKRGNFIHMCCASSWTIQNSDHPGDY